MPKLKYITKKFSAAHRAVVDRAVGVLLEYAAAGYDLTLRQLYYVFVSKAWIANNVKEYKRLGGIISDGRRAGLIDWDHIVDRTRNVHNPAMWANPEELVAACAQQFDVDWWDGQDYRPIVFVEKDALIGVLERACEPWHCPYFSCRGYTSDSEIWSIARRLREAERGGQIPIIFHLGDHDPSGIDMTRDVADRINLFAGDLACKIEVRRLALNMDQVEEHRPPPNPAKTTDSRYADYRKLYGDESWELDALTPPTIVQLVGEAMETIVDHVKFAEAEERRDEGRRHLVSIAERWDEVTKFLED